MADPTGRIFASTSNGTSTGRRPGRLPVRRVRRIGGPLAVIPNGTLAARDFFSPVNAPQGRHQPTSAPAGRSGCPSAPPPTRTCWSRPQGRPDLPAQPRQPGRRGQGPRGTDDALFVTQAYGGQCGHPAVFDGTPGTLTGPPPTTSYSTPATTTACARSGSASTIPTRPRCPTWPTAA